MRTFGLLLLLLGSLAYTLPIYRGLLPFAVSLGSDDTHYAGAIFVLLGIIVLLWSRRQAT